MKKENKILLLLALFCLLVVLFIELTSPAVLYRDPYMYRHLEAAQFISDKERINVVEEDLIETSFVGWQLDIKGFSFFPAATVYINYKNPVFFFVPVLSAVVFSFLSGLDIYFLFNHFFFLILISGLCFFVLFRELFDDSKLALGLSLIAVLFPFETLYYKISLHGWPFVRIFSALSLYFMVKLLKSGFSFKSKNFFLMAVFLFLGAYSDKSGFALVLVPALLFFVLFFFFSRKKVHLNKQSLNLFFLTVFFVFFMAFVALYHDLFRISQGIIFNLLELNFIPSFLHPAVPYSEFYLKKDFWYLLIRYALPFSAVFLLLAFNLRKIKEFFCGNEIKKSFLFSQILFYFFVAVPMLFSFYFTSSSAATWIFFFLCVVSFTGLLQMKKTFSRHFLTALFFLFVLIIPLLFFTQAPQYKYEQFSQKHLASIEWVQENLEKNSFIYSDVKMAKAVSLETDVIAVNPSYEFVALMENYIIPVYFDSNVEKVLQAFREQNINYLLLTKE
ncbi:MAG: hypothetical protein ABIJ74_00525, partial [archaeon]